MGKKKIQGRHGKKVLFFFFKIIRIDNFYLNYSNTHPKIRRVIVNTIHPRCVLEWYL